MVNKLPARVAHKASQKRQPSGARMARPLENGEGGVALVQMADLDLGGSASTSAPAADPEHDLLQQAHLAAAP